MRGGFGDALFAVGEEIFRGKRHCSERGCSSLKSQFSMRYWGASKRPVLLYFRSV